MWAFLLPQLAWRAFGSYRVRTLKQSFAVKDALSTRVRVFECRFFFKGTSLLFERGERIDG